jgi:diadenosine tetraphosphate (Ap4A) HIT family hydrolase
MTIIYESTNFIVEIPDKPLVDRNDGGHIIITPKIKVVDRQQLTPLLAIELMRLTIVTGQAMTEVMNEHGVNIGRINYQDNGNWSVFTAARPYLHIHLYGRAISAKYQKYGQACYFPDINDTPAYYKNFKPLMPLDITSIGLHIKQLMSEAKYSDLMWRLL